ncbi:MAG: hypothetical protein C0501_22235 [Isosphaera sp.]|nr:hypothetical protein [Isosphaera sp.]
MSRLPAAALAAIALVHLSATAAPEAVPQPRPKVAPADPYPAVLAGLKARNIGPANMGGRVTDLAVVESNPDTFYLATAGGGVWKTTDGGTTLAPVFDDQPTQSVGSVAVCQAKPEVVWVGTGEGNPRNSVSRGYGVFRSGDGGKTWRDCGLADTHHIGRVVAHPTDPDTAYVAALGHFWGPNKSRGLYKTTDGGKTWDLVQFLDADTGFVDLQMDPSDPNTLYAAAWQLRRDGYSGGSPRTQVGPAGGLFQSTDAGKTWAKMAGGLPEKADYGRCGLSVYRKDPKVVFAVVHTSETAGQTSNTGQPASAAGKVGPVEKGGVFRSEDKGLTWKKINDLVPRPFYYGQVRVDPVDEKNLYVLGVAFHGSSDGGRTFDSIGKGMHSDHHALWVNPRNPDHLIVGNDGGLYVSKDRGKTYAAKRGMVISQFYGVGVDDRAPYYRVYGGLQDNGSWGGPVATPYPDGVTVADWQRLLGGDGFQAVVDPTDPNTVYAEAQYGALSRITLGGAKGAAPKGIRPPAAPKGEATNRYNWNAPIVLSPHDPKTLYYGAQYLFKSVNRGDKWEKISPDLSAAPKDGGVLTFAHNILSAAESPAKAGVLWVGTDDGRLWVTKNDGKDWAEVGDKIPGVPKARAFPKIECPATDPGTAFVAIDRHRNDDFKPYIFLTTDYGQTWKSVAGDLPDGAVVGVVRQSSKAKNLLFAGTDIGLFASLDGGVRWHLLDKTRMPKGVRVDDVVIHPRERELVIGTHGRGVWVMDIAPLEQLTDQVLTADAHLFPFKPVAVVKERPRPAPAPMAAAIPKGAFAAKNPPAGPVAAFLLNGPGPERVTFRWKSEGGESGTAAVAVPGPGLHYHPLGEFKPGTYTVTLEARGVTVSQKVVVKADEKDRKVDE